MIKLTVAELRTTAKVLRTTAAAMRENENEKPWWWRMVFHYPSEAMLAWAGRFDAMADDFAKDEHEPTNTSQANQTQDPSGASA